ncbi:hypothetical protein [Inovirus D_HF3_19]|nr:hypothetical protein [Inovirus D_HF3_19]
MHAFLALYSCMQICTIQICLLTSNALFYIE